MLKNVKVPLSGGRNYDIWIGPVRELKEKLVPFTASTFITVADTNTAGAAAAMGLPEPVILPPGESTKDFAAAAMLCGEAARRGLDRHSVFFAAGGGVIGDLAGFAAAIYMRGVRVVQIPTSLLAMVDSSVGGKTAVDIPEGKNLAGAFHQPSAVLIAPEFLQTLPIRERIGGLAEVVKYGFALDQDFFAFLEDHAGDLTAPSPDPELFRTIIRRSCEIKAEIVAADEHESGIRKYLNYGHTYGHAVELISNFTLSHGEAVAIGMTAAARLAVRCGRISPQLAERQETLLRNIGLPCRIPKTMPSKRILEIMARDKKNESGAVTMVLPSGLGRVECVKFRDHAGLEAVAEELR